MLHVNKLGNLAVDNQMFLLQAEKSIILASKSPRRKDFLQRLGINFEVIPASIDETPYEGERPEAFVSRMARTKAAVVSRLHPDAWVIGADTVVTFAGDILGKPKNRDHAFSMLNRLSGHGHKVITGYTLACGGKSFELTRTSVTTVYFHAFSETVINAYVQTGEPLDKAGGYGIQGVGSFLVKEISGSYSNVVGLPIGELVMDLLKNKVVRATDKNR